MNALPLPFEDKFMCGESALNNILGSNETHVTFVEKSGYNSAHGHPENIIILIYDSVITQNEF